MRKKKTNINFKKLKETIGIRCVFSLKIFYDESTGETSYVVNGDKNWNHNKKAYDFTKINKTESDPWEICKHCPNYNQPGDACALCPNNPFKTVVTCGVHLK